MKPTKGRDGCYVLDFVDQWILVFRSPYNRRLWDTAEVEARGETTHGAFMFRTRRDAIASVVAERNASRQ